ncbi:MAG: PAS domain S-box protein [Hydrogenophaga sp.]|nr:PAS domain S-box protein [Hydrogenophaga sp.]
MKSRAVPVQATLAEGPDVLCRNRLHRAPRPGGALMLLPDTLSDTLSGDLGDQRRVHPIVKLDYGVRVVSHLCVGAVMLSVLLDQPPSSVLWVALALTSLLWPHVAYLVSSRAHNSKRAELRNLLGDALIVGAWSTLAGFSVWIAACFLVAITTANMSVGGVPLALKTIGTYIAGAVLAALVVGFRWNAEASGLTQGFSLVGLTFFNLMFSLQSNIQTRRAVQANREVKERNRLIEVQSAELDHARKRAELDRLAADEARLQAEEANRSKSSFLANVSHELRTPLNAVIGYTEMLEEDFTHGVNLTTAVSDLRRINGAARHLLGLINDVLDLSKIEAGKVELHLEDFELVELVDQVASTCQPLVAANGNRLEVALSDQIGQIRSDATRLRQVLFNLVSNAAKFTHGGVIRLDVRSFLDAQGDALVGFDITDSGIGMTPAQQGRLFQAFVQAEAETTSKYGGTGLGLVISRRLCRLLGGDVTVTSELGVGSCFSATVLADGPRRAPPAAEAWAERQAASLIDVQPARASADVDSAEASVDAASDERIRALVQAAPMFLILWRAADDEILLAGPSSERLFGYPPQDVVGLSIKRLYGAHSVDGEALQDALERNGEVRDHEVRFLRSSGDEFWGRVSAHHLEFGGRTCLIAGVIDISDLREAQITTLAASTAKTRFLSNVSHAMRTPLTDIIGYADLLTETLADDGAGTAAIAQAGHIRESGLTLLAMINDLLDYSSIETDELRVHLEPVNAHALVAEVKTAARQMMARAGKVLTVPEAPLVDVMADRVRLKQVLLHLLAHCSRSKDASEISLFATLGSDGCLDILVRHNGGGLTPRQLELALQPFKGTQETAPPAAGDLGLDLALSRGLCHRMGADFVAESAPGRGARYRVRLLLASAIAGEVNPLEAHAQDPAR